jgi:hypothetical protein
VNAKQILLAERRERLVNRSAEQRVLLAQNIQPWRVPLMLADRGITVFHYIKHHPEWMVGGVVLLIALRPGRVVNWLGHGLVICQMLYKLRAEQWKPEESR